MSTNSICIPLCCTFLCIFLMCWSFLTGLIVTHTVYILHISRDTEGDIHAEFVFVGHCMWQSVKAPHPLKAVTFFASCHRVKFPYNYCTWQVMILILAWISWAVTCCAYRTGPKQAADFLSGFDGGNKEPQNTHRVASRHSLAHLHSHLRSCQRCWLRQSLCVCCCAFVYGCVQRGCVWAHTVSQLQPAEDLLLIGAAMESRYETWHHSRRLTKTIRASPWISHTSTFSPLFLLCSSTNYAFTERIHTTTQAWIQRIIPCAAPQAVHLSSSRPHG